MENSFEMWLQRRGLAQKTIGIYLNYYQRLPQEITQEVVDDFLTKNNTPSARAMIKGYLKFSKNKDIEVLEQTGRKKKRFPKVITEEEVKSIEESMRLERNKLMLLCTFYGGLRKSEMLNIKITDINFKLWDKNQQNDGECTIIGKGDVEGLALFPPTIMFRLRNYINGGGFKSFEDRIFPISAQSWERILSKASKKAIDRHVNPHLLRHSIATELTKKGIGIDVIKEFLRHKDISSTQVYLHMDKSRLKGIISRTR